jgi:hypothetical protein
MGLIASRYVYSFVVPYYSFLLLRQTPNSGSKLLNISITLFLQSIISPHHLFLIEQFIARIYVQQPSFISVEQCFVRSILHYTHLGKGGKISCLNSRSHIEHLLTSHWYSKRL